MTMANAKRFIRQAMTNQDLRTRLNKAGTQAEREQILARESLSFSPLEWEEGFRAMLVQCQTRDQAELVQEIKSWWDFLAHEKEE
ncbi:MAG: Nif11-like leader peptide family natural product precursor [Desulfovibrionales bacterium]